MEVEQSSQFADFSANGTKPASDLSNSSPQTPDDPTTSGEPEAPQPHPADPVTAVPSSRPAGMPVLQQHGKVYIGPGAKKEAQVLGLGLSALHRTDRGDLDRAKRYAMDQSIKHVMQKQQAAHQENQQKVAMYAQALSLMARVYIGSISFEVREEQIRDTFSQFGPVKSINMSFDASTGHHKGYAFLEFEVPEGAVLAQEGMNGIIMGGRNIKVERGRVQLQLGRPQTMPQAQPIIDMIMTEARKFHRIYVASVHEDLAESDLRDVFSSFGNIVRCQLAKSPGGRHRGFGYIEFDTAKAAQDAIAGMNMFDLGGKLMRVGRCITPPEALSYIVPNTQQALPTAAAMAAAAITARIQAQEAAGNGKTTRFGERAIAAPPPMVFDPLAKDNEEKPKAIEAPPKPHRPSFAPAATVEVKEEKPTTKKPKDILSRIKLQPAMKPGEKATFAPLPSALPETNIFEEDSTPQLAITGSSESGSKALAVIEESKKKQVAVINKITSQGSGETSHQQGFKRKKKAVAKSKGPQLNTVQALEAATKAGALSDEIRAAGQENEEQPLSAMEISEIRGNDARHLLMRKLMRSEQTRVMLLKKMVLPEEVDDYLQQEVKEECEKYGPVLDVTVVQVRGEIRIFVKYQNIEDATKARGLFDKRWFNGRQIEAVPYDEELLNHRDFMG
ncbi:hypothetical protein FO519_004151 [Halicephalobus sp. NKZ332]|nr:hypothetical protein FO519_004151 [Halicephalobus sp. NKZ332]